MGQLKHRINYALAATLVAQGMSLADAAAQTGAKNANTLCVGLRRKGVIAKQARSFEPSKQANATLTLRVANQAGEVLRKRFAGLLDNVADKLNSVPVSANVKELKHLGEAAEPFVRMAKIVHDWGNDSPSGLVMVGEIAQVEADCGVDPAIGSVAVDATVLTKALDDKPQ